MFTDDNLNLVVKIVKICTLKKDYLEVGNMIHACVPSKQETKEGKLKI